MDCLGPQCAAMVLDWLESQAAERRRQRLAPGRVSARVYSGHRPRIRKRRRRSRRPRAAGAIEHLQYAVFRRYNNQLTRAERSRLDNTIDNALFKIDRYLLRRCRPSRNRPLEDEIRALRRRSGTAREQLEQRIIQARRADLKLAQLASLSAESFEEFVAELFEMLDFESNASAARATKEPTFGSVAATACWPSPSASITSKAWWARRNSRSSWARSTTPGATRASSSPPALLAGRGEVRRRKSHRASRRPASGRAHSQCPWSQIAQTREPNWF